MHLRIEIDDLEDDIKWSKGLYIRSHTLMKFKRIDISWWQRILIYYQKHSIKLLMYLSFTNPDEKMFDWSKPLKIPRWFYSNIDYLSGSTIIMVAVRLRCRNRSPYRRNVLKTYFSFFFCQKLNGFLKT